MARFSVGFIFSDNMVLQRRKNVVLWGEGADDRTITVAFGGEAYWGKVVGEKWQVMLPPHEYGGDFRLSVDDGYETIAFENVVFGEVWLAGGQSNMELSLLDSADGEKAVEEADDRWLRLYATPKHAVIGEELLREERENTWKVCSPKTAGAFSAVAYYCAKRFRDALDVPVGLIGCYWGGTSISCWMDEAVLTKSKAGQQYIDDYATLVGEKTDAQYSEEMDAYFAEWHAWNERVERRRAMEPDVGWEVLNRECGLCPWPQPAGRTSPFRPAGLFGSMIQRIAPYTLRGFLYYQGEEDAARCRSYGEMLCSLVRNWRSEWRDYTLPFLFVQLPMYISKEDFDKGEDNANWPLLREQQWLASQMIRNCGMAVTLDCGEFDNIHPANKQPVGERLALQALAKVYGAHVNAEGPYPVSLERQKDRLLIRFHKSGSGLMLTGEQAFELAGHDGQYHPATAQLLPDYMLSLQAEGIEWPQSARYAWAAYGLTPLYDGAGLPAAPFRIGESS